MAQNYLKPLATLEDVDKALYELGKKESFIAKKEAVMNEKIQNVKNKFEVETAEARAAKELIEKNIKEYLKAHKAEFLKQRTKQLVHGIIGFRYGTPKVLLLSKKYNTKTVLELVKKIFKSKYVRTKEELAKDVIITDYTQEVLTDEKLAAVGLRIDKGEKEVIEINWDSLESEA